MNVYKDQYQKFWQVAKGVGVLIYLELKHKIGMEGDDQFYKMSNHMFSSIYAVTRQRKYKAINKLLKANPRIAKAIEEGKISKEKVLSGIRSREEEKRADQKNN